MSGDVVFPPKNKHDFISQQLKQKWVTLHWLGPLKWKALRGWTCITNLLLLLVPFSANSADIKTTAPLHWASSEQLNIPVVSSHQCKPAVLPATTNISVTVRSCSCDWKWFSSSPQDRPDCCGREIRASVLRGRTSRRGRNTAHFDLVKSQNYFMTSIEEEHTHHIRLQCQMMKRAGASSSSQRCSYSTDTLCQNSRRTLLSDHALTYTKRLFVHVHTAAACQKMSSLQWGGDWNISACTPHREETF